ncbi:MAG: hypothetical protein Q3983_01575 [Capnocytophaga sp.]|nr:hypothetical protein [Capnocytophaga sp.]
MDKKQINILLKILCIIVLPFIFFTFTSYRSEKRKIKEVQIKYTDLATNLHSLLEEKYITEQNVHNLLFVGISPEEQLVNQVSIHELEQKLDAHPMVQNAEIFMTIDGILKIRIKQRKPIGRIWKGNTFSYMDSEGKEMPLSDAYSARVPIVRGISEAVWGEAFQIIKYIYEDNFLSQNVVEIIADRGIFHLKMRSANFDIILGKAQELKTKFNNLKAFYKKADKDNFLEKYSQVNLQYSNQVVCTK